MPAPKDPEKRKQWQERLSKVGKGKKPWNAGKQLKGDPEYEDYLGKLSESQKGKHTGSPSEETRAKISKSLKGKYKGKVVSAETRAKLSITSKGRAKSEETLRKLSESHKGKKHTAEAKTKMSASRKGKASYIPTEETKAKISATLKSKNLTRPAKSFGTGSKHTDEAKAKMSAARAGVPKSVEHKRKISEAHKGKKHNYYSPGMKGKTFSAVSRKRLSETLKQLGPNAGAFKKGRVIPAEELERLRDISVGHFKQGYHESSKAGKVHYRSSYELEVFKQLDATDDVKTYEVESVIVPYEYEGYVKQYMPDLKIIFTDGDWLIVEIKPAAHINWPKNIAKFSAATAQFGDRFEIWSEELIFQ